MFEQDVRKKKRICQGRQPPTELQKKANVFPTNLVVDSNYYFYVLIAITFELLHSTVFLDELTTYRFVFFLSFSGCCSQ